MIGVEAASHPYIFFGEDDAYLSPGHIKTLFDFVATGGPDAAASYWLTTTVVEPDPLASCSLPCGSSAADFVNLWEFTLRADLRISQPTMVPWLHTLALIRKELLIREGFDPNYRGNAFREETDFYLRAYHHGAKLYLVDAPPAFHYKGQYNSAGGQHGRASFQSFLIYEHWVARNNYYFLRKNADAVRSLRHMLSPFFETALYMLRRGLGYPGRFRFELRRRLGTARTIGATRRDEMSA
jgi:GT2 family glycosyltransferase